MGTFPQTFPKSANVLNRGIHWEGKVQSLISYSPVEPRYFIAVRKTTFLFSASGLRTFSSTSSAAHLPISIRGGSTVVSCGNTMVDSSVPENPATATSSGTRRPSSRRRFMAPMASVSVKAYTASKSTSCCTRRSTAAAPSANVIPVLMIS